MQRFQNKKIVRLYVFMYYFFVNIWSSFFIRFLQFEFLSTHPRKKFLELTLVIGKGFEKKKKKKKRKKKREIDSQFPSSTKQSFLSFSLHFSTQPNTRPLGCMNKWRLCNPNYHLFFFFFYKTQWLSLKYLLAIDDIHLISYCKYTYIIILYMIIGLGSSYTWCNFK